MSAAAQTTHATGSRPGRGRTNHHPRQSRARPATRARWPPRATCAGTRRAGPDRHRAAAAGTLAVRPRPGGRARVTQPLISQHLRVLKAAGVVEGERKGREVLYSLVDDHLAHIVGTPSPTSRRTRDGDDRPDDAAGGHRAVHRRAARHPPTRQRAAVTAALLDRLDDFRSAQEIHEELRRAGEGIGLTTVYRTCRPLPTAARSTCCCGSRPARPSTGAARPSTTTITSCCAGAAPPSRSRVRRWSPGPSRSPRSTASPRCRTPSRSSASAERCSAG